jgi:flavodoxin/NAD-dependent dihydropyrimidine dehydrogenase PreA subunit
MKIALFYYSASGNTKLACEYLRKQIPEIELVNITDIQKPAIEDYDIVGFASFTYYLILPPFLRDFIISLKPMNDKPAFLLFTYGLMPGKVIKHTGNLLAKKGFSIIDYHTLHMPESFPPYIQKGIANTGSPGKKEFEAFRAFISNLQSKFQSIFQMRIDSKKNIKLGFWDFIIPAPNQKKIQNTFGTLYVNKDECTSCGICQDSCLHNAITFNVNPAFHMENCSFCYNCYNKCPQEAIRTTKLAKGGQYKGPGNVLKDKFI